MKTTQWMLAACLAAAPVLAPVAAWAHAHLQSAVPPAGSTVKQAPPDVTIAFTEALEPKFSTITVTDAKGARMEDGAAASVPGDAKRLAVKLKPLSPGVYTVVWHATSVDTHKTEGTFSFTVAP